MTCSPFAARRRLLITLDLCEDRRGASPPTPWAAACARVLGHARRERWDVIHLRPEAGVGGRPIAGLEPRPSEAILPRAGLSLLRVRALAARLEDYDDVYLAGFWLSAPGLAGLFDAHDVGVRLTLVEDAVAAPCDAPNPGVTEVTLRQLVGPYHRSTRSEQLLARAEPAFTRLAANNA